MHLQVFMKNIFVQACKQLQRWTKFYVERIYRPLYTVIYIIVGSVRCQINH